MNKQELINFEEWVIQAYKDGKLRSPVHLSRGNEDQLIEIFKQIKPNDWVISTYRSHYHSLLKGVDPEWLKEWILNNKSIHVMNKEHKIITSAIVGGTLPIALGIALGIKLNRKDKYAPLNYVVDGKYTEPHVWCFVGDMTGRTGGFWECLNYANNHNLPITFIIEDNGLSTDTKTEEVWNDGNQRFYDIMVNDFPAIGHPRVIYYKYERGLPHYGCGVFVDFKDDQLKQDGKNF